MATFLFSLIFLLLVVGAMAVGVIFSHKPIKGSCGGIQALGMGGDCDICGGDPLQCDEEEGGAGLPANANANAKSTSSFYDASK